MARKRSSRAKLRRRFPKILAELYSRRIRTLRQLILELLGPSLKLSPCICKEPGEEYFKYCASCDPSTYILRDDDHADYWTLLECSYGVVSNTAPRIESFALENRWSQLQIIERATKLHFREGTRPLNVICFGYRQPEPNKAETGSTSAPYGLECASTNLTTRLLNSQAWMILLSRVGDMFMLHLLLYTSVFYPLPNNSYLQVTGIPISNLISCHQPHESGQSGNSGITRCCSVNPAATGMCKTSGFQFESEWSHAKDDCQLKAYSHCVQMDRKMPLAEYIGFGLNLSNSSRNWTGMNGYERVCRDDKKRPYISDYWTTEYKNMKADRETRTFKQRRLFVDSNAVCRSGDHCEDGCSAGTTALDYQHIGHVIAEMNASYRPLKEHSGRGSVNLPRSCSHLSNKSQRYFLPSLESDLTYDPVFHPGCEGEEHVMQNCSNLENISIEALQSSSYDVAKHGGQSKKRCRPFRWQRCERYKARKRVCKVKDGTLKDSLSSQQLLSPSDFHTPMGNDRYLKRIDGAFQYVSPNDSMEKLNVAREFSDKILVYDQMFSLESNLQSLNGKEDSGQKVDMFQHVKWNGLSSSKDNHICQYGIEKVDNVLISISKNQTRCPCKNQCCSKFIINTTNPVAFEKGANHKKESTHVYNRRKMFCRCLCWLTSHMKHMDEVNTLISRHSLFYNSRRLYNVGFPKNYILNVIKPSNAGAKKLFILIFGLQVPCLCNTCACHEDLIGGAKGFESLSKVSPLLSLLRVLIKNARHCKFARLLERHCPIQVKHQTKVFSVLSSKITNSFFSEDDETQDKETRSILHGTGQKDNNHIDVEIDSTSQVLPGHHGPYAENNCLIHCNDLNKCSLLRHADKLGCQHVSLADCFGEETHGKESFSEHSHVHKLTGKRTSKDYVMSGMNGNMKGQDSVLLKKLPGGCKAPSKDFQNELIRSYASHNEVVSFIWAVCRRIIPDALLGSKRNWRALRSNISRFVKLRRFENITLQQCLYKLKTSHYPWLNRASLFCEHCVYLNSSNDGDKYCSYPYCLESEGSTYQYSTDRRKGGKHSHKDLLKQRMLANWIFWLFSNFIVPLIQAHFYVTESENGRQNVFYYRKSAWAKILKGVVKNLRGTNYRRLSAVSLAKTLQRRSLGFSRVRFLPKATGVRPIANLGAPSTMWLQLQNNPVQTAKTGNRNTFANNLLILNRNGKTKFPKQKDYTGRSTQAYVDNLQREYDLNAKKGDRFASFSFHALISDKLKKERRSDSQVKLSFRSVNSHLCDLHHCLKLEQEDFPEALGCSVFDYNDIYQKFIPFVLSVKDYFIGLPKLYIAVCDVAKAFDTINHDKLLDVIRNILQKEEYLVQRYTKVSCSTKSFKVSHGRCSVPEKGIGFVNFLGSLSSKHSQCIFIDQAFCTRIKREELLALITEHVKRNILQIGPHFYIQKVGITQGSVLSPLLCSFYFGHLDRNRILPLLGHNQKKHIIDFPEKTVMNRRLIGDVSSSKVLSQASWRGGVGACFFEEKDKISGISTRVSQSMGIAKETLDLCLTGCSRDTREYCSCNNLNESEIRHCESVSPKSILLRLIDDSLFISTSKMEAFSFIAAMHKGFEDYNCYTNEQKTSLNFDMELEGRNLAKNIYETEDGSCFMQWSGLLINCHTLEIQADYTRYCGTHISSTVTVSRQKNPGYHLMVKLCQFMRPKCHPIFYDSNINSPTTVRLNAYQAFLLCAMKFHVYMCSMPSVGACSPRYVFQAIMNTTRYMYKLLKQRMHSIGLKSSSRPIFSLQRKEMEWLGFSAYHKVLWRKQSRYRPLLSLLETKLHSLEYQNLVASLDLQFAVDDSRSSMFWQIQY